MVLSERVAWPEYMDIVRAALTMQAEAIIKQGAALEAGSSRGGIVVTGEVSGGGGGGGGGSRGQQNVSGATPTPSVNGSARRTPSPGLNLGAVSPESTFRGGGGGGGGSDEQQQRQTGVHHGSSRGELSRSRDVSGASVAAASSKVSPGNEDCARSSFSPSTTTTSDNHHSWNKSAAAAGTADVRLISFGETVRGTTAPGPESWTFFRFNLPSAGPVVTVVLDISDGDPGMVVSRGELPSSPGFGSRNSTAEAFANDGDDDAGVSTGTAREESREDSPAATAAAGATAAVVPALARAGGNGGDGCHLKAAPAHRGLRVVKVFPRHPKCVQ